MDMISRFNTSTPPCIMVICALISLDCACRPGCRAAPTEKQTAVVLTGADGHEIGVKVEVAARAEERARGLMYRSQLDEKAGMLFVYPAEAKHSFWMKNTYISLDLIFINNNLRVVGMLENTQPMSTQSLSVETPSRLVLEVCAGFVKKHAIRQGSRVLLEGIRLEI